MKEGTLIPPIPKEYLTYSDQEKIEKTEKYYQKIDELYRRMEKTGGDYTQKLDLLLQNHAAWKDLYEVLMEKEAQILCLYQYEFFILKILCQIAEKEEVLKETSILHCVHSMAEGVGLYQKCIFLLRRFEVEWEADEELYSLVKEKKVSYVCLAEIVCKEEIVRKIYTACSVAKYLYERGLTREAVLFLMWLEKQLPYSDRKIMLFSMTLLDMGERRLAYETLMTHQNPDKDILELQTALREML